MRFSRRLILSASDSAFGAWYAYLIGSLPERSVMPNTPGPSFFPIIIVSAVLMLSAALLVSGVLSRHDRPVVPAENKSWPAAAITIGAFVAYLAVLPYAGFLVASVPFFAVLMYLYASRNMVMIAGASLVIPIALFTMFRYGFQIILPRGVLAF